MSEKKRFSERFKLVRLDLDASAKGRLEQFWVRCGNTIPTKGSRVGRKKPRSLAFDLEQSRARDKHGDNTARAAARQAEMVREVGMEH
jgi:hypothetical protein